MSLLNGFRNETSGPTAGTAAKRPPLSGVWQCNLSDESLVWTDGVYDIFGIPRGRELRRGETLAHYAAPSLRALEEARNHSIATGAPLRLDLELVTSSGVRRWMRVAGAIERINGTPRRIFGLKQDVTEERMLADATRRMNELDLLTGLPNRRLLEQSCAALANEGGLGGIALIDLDGFARVNEAFGRKFGDVVLAEAGSRVRKACADVELVARVGGDEFAVLFGDPFDRGALSSAARRIVEALRMDVTRNGRSVALSASVGIGGADHLGHAAAFIRTSAALAAAKAAGRGLIRLLGPGENAILPVSGGEAGDWPMLASA